MNKPKAPCKKDCPNRSVGCHSAECPFGWEEYQRKMEIFRVEKHERVEVANYLHDSLARNVHKRHIEKEK